MAILLDHTRAVLGLLNAAPGSSPLKVQNGQVGTTVAPPYVLVYFSLRTPVGADIPQDVSLEAYSDVIICSAYCHSVGADIDAALSVGGRVRGALLGQIPAVTGRQCYPIQHDDGAPVNRDETTNTAVFDLVDVYSFKSIPA
jgi:hypothetical protein